MFVLSSHGKKQYGERMLAFICVALFAFALTGVSRSDYLTVENEDREMKIILGDDVISEPCNVQCNPNDKYRTIDGSCNNLQNPCWGKALRGYNSWIPPQFADGIGCPRKAKAGTTPLPIPRTVSQEVHPDVDIKAPKLSQLVNGFGQSIAVEFSAALDGRKIDNKYSCPDVENSVCKDKVEIPSGDPHLPSPSCSFILPNVHIRCNGTGSICGCSQCKSGQLEFVNGATPFLDASTVYGSSERVLQQVRDPNSAKLKTSPGNLLSRSSNDKCTVFSKECDDRCFNTGAEAPGNGDVLILSLYTMWMREHNRLVDKFSELGIFPDQETLFQEVRRIVGAMMQHVFYKEFLPLMLGNCSHPSLKTPTSKKHLKYDAELDPTVVSECYVGACRLGHTLLDGNTRLYNSRETWSVGEAKNVELFCSRGGRAIEDIIGGMCQQRAMKRDPFVTDVITNKLHFPGQNYTDLIAIDITRGRQRGIPGYVELLKHCGYKVPTDFDGLKKYFPTDIVEKYRRLYGEDGMENIDLNSAMLTEKRIGGCSGIWGPVTTCIVSEQFRALKFGDRFWYEFLEGPQAFTKDQVREIQKTTIARLICSNTDINVLQRNALLKVSRRNREVPCQRIEKDRDLDLYKWNE